jgi:uncharacterized SAM-binding protein YcdF (DUF218 family)
MSFLNAFSRKHRFRWIVCLLAAVGALVLAGYVFRAPLLTGLAEAWVVNDPATKADAIVILGGGLENRPFMAAKLFHAGVAPLILYMDVQPDPVESLGLLPTEKEITRRILLSKDVPAAALLEIGTNVANTFDESRAVRAWVRRTGASTIVITTDLFHTRRARWIFRHELRDTTAKISIVAVDPIRYGLKDWWHHEEGVISFQNEVIKSIYYHLKY